MNQLNIQDIIGGDFAPLHVNDLDLSTGNNGSLLGTTMAIESDLIALMVRSFQEDNRIAFNHLFTYLKCKSTSPQHFEKMLNRCFIPIIATGQGAEAPTFERSDECLLPHVGHIVSSDGNTHKYVTGHKFLLNNFSPIQIINVCVNCAPDVIKKCCYQCNGTIWQITNIKELFTIVAREKSIMFNKNKIDSYKNDNRAMFAMAARNRNLNVNMNRRSIQVNLPRVYVDMSFSTPMPDVWNNREVNNQIGKLGWKPYANFNDGPEIYSIVARRNGDTINVSRYSQRDYSINVNSIEDPSLVTRQVPNMDSHSGRDHHGHETDEIVHRIRIIDSEVDNFGNLHTLFGDNFRDTSPIPDAVLQFNGTIGGNNADADLLKKCYGMIRCKYVANEQISLFF